MWENAKHKLKKKKPNSNKFQISIWKVEKSQEMKMKMKTCTKQAIYFLQKSQEKGSDKVFWIWFSNMWFLMSYCVFNDEDNEVGNGC